MVRLLRRSVAVSPPELEPEATSYADHTGERLLQAGLISRDQLTIGLHEQRRNGGMIGQALVRLGFLTEEQLASVLAARTGYEKINLKSALIDQTLLQKLPKDVALRCRAVPLRLNGDSLEIAMADPYDLAAMDEVRRYFPRSIALAPCVASATEIAERLAHYDDPINVLENILRELETGSASQIDDGRWEHPIVRLVDTILIEAARRGASDIHLEPEASCVRLRYRIDGVMEQIRIIHRAHWPELSSRVKIMSGLNIADTRSMQDGRFERTIGGAAIDFRVAVMPTVQGENIVVRLLDHRRALLSLDELGFSASAQKSLQQILQRPEGIILLTGPTGSGKTTSLYAMLTRISSTEVNIMTLEDPVEYQFELIRQSAVQEHQGLGFAEGVRGILRQDPDIIFVGEVRDTATAQMALRAAMTGHRVFSTLHCNDALGALPRLIDLGMQPRMLADNIGGVIAQRLARRLCPQCRAPVEADAEETRILNLALGKAASSAYGFGGMAEMQAPLQDTDGTPVCDRPMIHKSVGCDFCHGTGYRGRVAISEILRITPALDALIAKDASRAELQRQALADGLQTLAADGAAKVLAGEISFDSLRRAVDLTRLG